MTAARIQNDNLVNYPNKVSTGQFVTRPRWQGLTLHHNGMNAQFYLTLFASCLVLFTTVTKKNLPWREMLGIEP